MSDLISALNVILNFVPDRPLPGLNCVLFEQVGEQYFLYATNGYLIVRMELDPSLCAGDGSALYLDPKDLEQAAANLEHEETAAITAFGRDVMLCAGAKCLPIKLVRDGDFTGDRHKFFEEVHPVESVVLSIQQIIEIINLCSPLLASYERCGPAMEVRVQPVHWKKEVSNMALITLRLLPELRGVHQLQVAIMGMSV